MTATDELRRLLDERGVKWDYGITGATSTRFSANGVDVTFVPIRYGLICSTILTSAQVVKVMLGRGECRNVCNSISEFTCSECGFNCDLTSWISLFDGDDGRHRHHHHGVPNYCPNCGLAVKR